MSGRPDVAGILASLGRPDAARTARVADAMAAGRPYASLAWPTPERRFDGQPARRRTAARTGRSYITQPRDELGRFDTYDQEER